jgi:hypothetical protein
MDHEEQLAPDEPRVIIVHLRRPRRGDANEARSDPYYEFGSFGCTGCHGKNLLHKNRIADVQGARLAFTQGGNSGFRLVFLSPPIKVIDHGRVREAKWRPISRPMRYGSAPILARNDGVSDFPLFKSSLAFASRPTLESQLSSSFRTRVSPLRYEISQEIIRVYETMRKAAGTDDLARSYVDALPWLPPSPEKNRRESYQRNLLRMGAKLRRC